MSLGKQKEERVSATLHSLKLPYFRDEAETGVITYSIKDKADEGKRLTLKISSAFILDRYDSFISETDFLGNVNYFAGVRLRMLGRSEGDTILASELADKYQKREHESAPDTFILLRNAGMVSMSTQEFTRAMQKKGLEIAKQYMEYDASRGPLGLGAEVIMEAAAYGRFGRYVYGTVLYLQNGFTVFSADVTKDGQMSVLNFDVKEGALKTASNLIEERTLKMLSSRRLHLNALLRSDKENAGAQEYLQEIAKLDSYDHVFRLNANLSTYFRKLSMYLGSLGEKHPDEVAQGLLLDKNSNPEEALLFSFREVTKEEKRKHESALLFIIQDPDKAYKAIKKVIYSKETEDERFAYATSSLLLLSRLSVEDRVQYSDLLTHDARKLLSEEHGDMLINFTRKSA